MIIKNVRIFTADHTFSKGAIRISEDGEIRKMAFGAEASGLVGDGESVGEAIYDGEESLAIPGLIDLHFHGCVGSDVGDASREALEAIAGYQASEGITAIAPATMTVPVEELEKILKNMADYRRNPSEGGADLVGINMEGPFISRSKKGAQAEENILECNAELTDRFLEASDGLVKFIGLAPEENPNFESYIESVRDRVTVAIAHSNVSYEEAKAAMDAGAGHVVHLYNAMSPFTHREPGVFGAAADSEHVRCEIIGDGIHIHPAAVRVAFRVMGEERMILVSDSLRATGMEDGEYILGGQTFRKEGKVCRMLLDGAIAGSVTNLADCLREVVLHMDIPLETAVRCASENPARSLGIFDRYGSLEEGKIADIVLLRPDERLSLRAVFKSGKLIREN